MGLFRKSEPKPQPQPMRRDVVMKLLKAEMDFSTAVDRDNQQDLRAARAAQERAQRGATHAEIDYAMRRAAANGYW